MSLPVTAAFALGTAVELYLLVLLSNYFDTVTLLNEIMFTFLWGIVLGRSYGKEYFEKLQWHLKSRTLPPDEAVNGAVLAVASMLLITPGVVTDLIGFLMTLPASRGLFKEIILELVRKRNRSGEGYFFFRD
ncbi:MAG: hypothetical protein COV67_01600 [Nitrospinae bacterium CG11_big_fil_rev_8_21_14_0_20_56_8]|nr:MAG: hypothetical protein COV67_01600 [Nitrospinae bacterium CG11_big_fil_rev_8_21_14_0_20_56_8]